MSPKGIISVTTGLPSVRVPVLSKTSVLIFSACSSAEAFLNSTPICAPRPVPTIIAVGVASPSAQGQEITNTVTALISAKIKSSKNHQVSNRVRMLISTTIGTNILEILSAIL